MFVPKDQMNKYQQDQSRFQPGTNPNQAGGADEARPVEFGAPQFEEQSKGYDPNDVADAYAQFDENNLEQPYPDDIDETHNSPDEMEVGFDTPPSWEGVRDYPQPESMREPGGAFIREEPICPGGPPRSEVMSWKKQFEQDGHAIHLSEIADEIFIWRTLARNEYREVMALPNTDPLQREEILCEVCTLFPYEYNFTEMASRKAGIPAQLAEQIMQESGFRKASPPIRL